MQFSWTGSPPLQSSKQLGFCSFALARPVRTFSLRMVRPQLAQQFAGESRRERWWEGRQEWLIHAAKQSSRFRRFSDLRSLILPHIATDVHHVSLNVRKSRSCKRSTQAYTHHDGESGCIFTHQIPRGCSVQLDQCQSLPSPLRFEESFCSSERSCVLLVLRLVLYCSTSPESSVTLAHCSSSLFLTEFALWATKIVVLYFQPATHYGSHLELFCNVVKN